MPHCGGPQIAAGSAQEQILRQWVDLVAQAQCSGAGGGGAGGDAWVRSCASCHAADGTGGNGAPDVRCTVRSLLADAVRRGRGTVMPAFASADVSATDLQEIETYLAGLCTGKPADLFASNCATCHGPTAGGGRNADGIAGPNIRCSGGSDFVEAVRFGGDGMPAFGGLGANAIGGLETYVRGLCSLGGGASDD